MTLLARILKLSAAFLGSNLARAAIGFGLSLALARGLGAERFGRWILCTAWASTLIRRSESLKMGTSDRLRRGSMERPATTTTAAAA